MASDCANYIWVSRHWSYTSRESTPPFFQTHLQIVHSLTNHSLCGQIEIIPNHPVAANVLINNFQIKMK